MSDRYALIIASYEYQDPELRQLVAPAHDAEALARVLQNPDIGDFQVQTLLNEPSYKVSQAIETFFTDRRRDDLLLLFFSGHGVKDEDGHLYFATSDTRRRWLISTAVWANFVNRVMRRSRSRKQVLFLDCCYSGAFARGMVAKASMDVGTKERFEGRGRVVLTASNAMQYAFEGGEVKGKGVQSVFTRTVVRGLETGEADLDRDGFVSLDELYDYVHNCVTDETPHQRPGKWVFDVEGQIVIARNPLPIPKMLGLPLDLQKAIESPAGWMREGAASGLERLMEGEGEIAQIARVALEQLANDENPRVVAAAVRVLGIETKPQEPVLKPAPSPKIEKPKPESKPDVLTITSPIHLELVRIPAGEFLMGSDPAKDGKAYGDEQPQHTIGLPEFYIGKYPVTNAQYAAFVKTTDHRVPDHWKDSAIPSGKEDHPVVYVSWRDAIAFCEWLSEKTDKNFSLPSEAEWEKAARGVEGRIYPWGDESPTADLCNFGNNVNDTTPVGKYSPKGDSPYGCADMAGNVWEWTRSLWGKDWTMPDFGYPYDPKDGRENLDAGNDVRRVLRGGSFVLSDYYVRCASRYNGHYPYYRFAPSGFRLVASPFTSGI